MGAGASVDLADESQKKLYEEMKDMYNNECKNGMSDEDAYKLCKERFDKIMADSNNASPSVSPTLVSSFPSAEHSMFSLGDIVQHNRLKCDGIVVEILADNKCLINKGIDEPIAVAMNELTLLKTAFEFEVGDKVQMCAEGTAVYFMGHILEVHEKTEHNIVSFTYDIEMGEDDIETDVKPENIRKILSHRLTLKRIKKLVNAVKGMVAFKANHGVPSAPEA